MSSGRPVLEPDLKHHARATWPAFLAAVAHDEISSIFAFPLSVGPLRMGAVDLFSSAPLSLNRTQTRQADAMAGVVSRHVLRRALTAVGSDEEDTGVDIVEVMQLSAEAGPCIESFRTGQLVSVPDIREAPVEWARFRQSALEQGFQSVHSLPLRLRETTIGTLNLLRDTTDHFDSENLAAARAFADVATIGILHERWFRETALLAEQLQGALSSRVVVEQAKGVVAHTRGVPIDEAFTLIRTYARSHQLGISEVAARLVERSLEL